MCQPTIRHSLDDHDIVEQLMHSAATLVDETEVVLASRQLPNTGVRESLRSLADTALDARSHALVALALLPKIRGGSE